MGLPQGNKLKDIRSNEELSKSKNMTARRAHGKLFFSLCYVIPLNTSQKDPYFTFPSPFCVKLILLLFFPCQPPKIIRSKGAFVFLEFSSQGIHGYSDRMREEIIGVDNWPLYAHISS